MFEIEEERITYIENNEPIGFIEFTHLDSKTVDIIYTFVSPEHRGKGIGKKLVTYALEYFKEKNMHVKYTCSYVNKHHEKQ